jgi:mycothiol synthase
MLLLKNRYLEATTTLLGCQNQGEALLTALGNRPEGSFDLYGIGESGIHCSLLLLINTGSTVTCIASPAKSEAEKSHTSDLISEALNSPRIRNIQFAQTILRPSDHSLAQTFTDAGFTKLALLDFLEQRRPAKKVRIPKGLAFASITSKNDTKLGELLEATYVGSLDCPKIHGLRPVQNIIEGHRGEDPTISQVWCIAELESEAVGVILLNANQKQRAVELAYFGLLPNWRGKGFADPCMQYIANQTEHLGFSTVTLAVDADNYPAQKLYKKWNFRKTKQRLTLIQKLL